MSLLLKTLRDPLTHFLAAGAALFAILSALAPPHGKDAKETITVDRAKIVDFVQYRSKALEPDAAAHLFDSLSPADRQSVVNDYVKEEALFREAKSLGLESADHVIRERMAQSALFLAGAGASPEEPTGPELRAYFTAHKADYHIDPSITFAHVFFEGKNAEARARAALLKLNRAHATFDDAAKYGDRFPFNVTYIERSHTYVASQFGDAATGVLFDAKTPTGVWIGPLRSEYGVHIAWVTRRTAARDPDFDEIKERVAEDAKRDNDNKARARTVDDIVKQYKVTHAKDLDAPTLQAPEPPR